MNEYKAKVRVKDLTRTFALYQVLSYFEKCECCNSF